VKSKGVMLEVVIGLLAVKILWDIIEQVRFGKGVTEGTIGLMGMMIICFAGLSWKRHSN
jgi:hypothetical protein